MNTARSSQPATHASQILAQSYALLGRVAVAGILVGLLLPGAFAASPSTPAEKVSSSAGSQAAVRYHFDLTKGSGRAECEADLKRLNTAAYSGPPGCDQPQTTTVPGFTPLHRVPLSAKAVHILFKRVQDFMALGVQGSREQDEAISAERKKLGLSPTWTLDEIEGYMRRGYIKVWRYDPPIDIDNDGVPDNLVVWQGIPISTVPGVCGIRAFGERAVYFQPQVAFVLDAGNARLDTAKTKAVFGRPGGNLRFRGEVLRGFEPRGMSIGIFEYRGLNYFQTFTGFTDPALRDTLGVFLRRHGKTAQICEYHMTTRHIHAAAGTNP